MQSVLTAVSLQEIVAELNDLTQTLDSNDLPEAQRAELRAQHDELIPIALWLCTRQNTHQRTTNGRCPTCTGPTALTGTP